MTPQTEPHPPKPQPDEVHLAKGGCLHQACSALPGLIARAKKARKCFERAQNLDALIFLGGKRFMHNCTTQSARRYRRWKKHTRDWSKIATKIANRLGCGTVYIEETLGLPHCVAKHCITRSRIYQRNGKPNNPALPEAGRNQTPQL